MAHRFVPGAPGHNRVYEIRKRPVRETRQKVRLGIPGPEEKNRIIILLPGSPVAVIGTTGTGYFLPGCFSGSF